MAAVSEGRVDATILAAAGLERLNIVPPSAIAMNSPDWLPAPGQGIIVVQHRAGDERVAAWIAKLGCDRTHRQALAEREIVRALGGDCTMPLAAHAEIEGDRMVLRGRLGDHDGTLIDAQAHGSVDRAEELGSAVARELLENGGRELLARLNP